MSDLKTRYMGLTLKAPLVASGVGLCESAQSIARLEDNGIAAVVLPSLFEEQLGLETMRVNDDFHRGADCFYESLRFFPKLENLKPGPDRYLNLIREAKKRVETRGKRPNRSKRATSTSFRTSRKRSASPWRSSCRPSSPRR